MIYDYSGVDPDAAVILQDMAARLDTLEAAPKAARPNKYVLTYPEGSEDVYNLAPTVVDLLCLPQGSHTPFLYPGQMLK